MQKQELQSSIKRKTSKIQLLTVVLRAIKILQEKKSRVKEAKQLEAMEAAFELPNS